MFTLSEVSVSARRKNLGRVLPGFERPDYLSGMDSLHQFALYLSIHVL